MTTLPEAIRHALETRWRRSKDQERTHARATLAARLLPRGLSAEGVTPRHLVAVQDQLLERGLAPSTVNRHLAALQGALRSVGVTPSVPSLRESRGREFVPTRPQVAAMLRALPPREARLARFLLRTGMRLGEAISPELRVEGGYAHLPDSKTGKERVVPLPPNISASPPRVPRATFARHWASARTLASLPREFVPHSLRHYSVSGMVQAGVPLAVVAAYHGHASTRTTERYTHVRISGLEGAAGVY